MDHLLPNICAIALLPVEQRIAKLRSDYWIEYTRAQEALHRMEELLNHPQKIRMPTMLDALGAPINYSTTAQYESIAIKLMKATEVKILIVDELHNLLAGNNNVQREFLNVLRFIGNTMKIPIVGVSIKDAYLAIRSDDQLENRFELINEH
jgi:hypothetical protein